MGQKRRCQGLLALNLIPLHYLSPRVNLQQSRGTQHPQCVCIQAYGWDNDVNGKGGGDNHISFFLVCSFIYLNTIILAEFSILKEITGARG